MRLPGSTYRIQCRAGVGIRDVTGSLGYLQALGITDVYLSPIALARSGSTHGYDVCDPNTLDNAIGTTADLEELARVLESRRMGLLLDIVPNHLAADEASNPWWRDVLENGPQSPYAPYFDIDWNPPNPALAGKVLLPVLDRPYSEALELGEIRIEHRDDRRVVSYGTRYFPLASVDGRETEIVAPAPSKAGLHAILERQHYRLAHWRTAIEEINYRRFFNIEHLVGVRVEDTAAFDATHRWLCRLIGSGTITGVRVDHPDGLAAPADYLWRLQRLAGRAAATPLYIVVEKVLVGAETLPVDWPVQGTTGYEFLNALNNLFVAPRQVTRLERGYARFVGRQASFERTEYDAKRQVIEATFTSECERLVMMLKRLAERDRQHRDLGLPVLRRALTELTACLPVYRTYVDRRGCRAADLVVIGRALRRLVSRQRAGVDARALAFISSVVTSPKAGRDRLAFVTRWQQFTSAVFAKAVEDRAFYRDNTLLSLNEVGSDRARPGLDVAAFHAANAARVAQSPYGLLATTTHDTKLSEDVRARLNVLTECSQVWLTHMDEWRRLNNKCRRRLRRGTAPDRDDEYRFYQLLVGLWPADASTPPDSIGERVTAALIKGAREAARRTSWTAPNAEYEGAISSFVARTIAGHAFVASVATFACVLAKAGLMNSLAQTVFKIGSPGVPDFYQGTELCSLRLADPDNRQPVDTAYRQRMLADLRHALDEHGARIDLVNRLFARWRDGAVKMFVTAEALRMRASWPLLFTHGGYTPLVVDQPIGQSSPELVAFARTHEGRSVVVAAPRFAAGTTMNGGWPIGVDVWKDSAVTLPASIESRTFTDCFTGETIAALDDRLLVRDLLRLCPVSLAISTGSARPG